MPAVTIPFDYDERTHPSVVPICIDDTDAGGNLIYRGWIEHGVVPAADRLRRAAKVILRDVWRVSEITESALHSIWANRGTNLGDDPDLTVVNSAYYHAVTLARGGWRRARGLEVDLFDETIQFLRDGYDMILDAENKDKLDRLIAQAEALGMEEAVAMVPMMLRGCHAEEYERKFGMKRNTLAQMFFRHMRKAADVADISW
jgi:hypothetical protein